MEALPRVICQACGSVFEHALVGPPRKYCSDTCRARASRARRRVDPVCVTCGAVMPGGHRGRKYCSKGCRPKPQPRPTTKRASKPCAICGEPMWVGGKGSLPVGQATCLPCRQERRRQRPVLRPRRLVCAECNGPMPGDEPRRRKYCSEGCLRRASNRRGSGGKSPAPERGYDAEHRRLRRRLLPAAFGTPCALCGEVMVDGDDLHLDHTEDRTGYRGFSHAVCNVRDGARRGGAATRAKKLREGQ